jgi:hypothetical protein
LKTIAPTKLVTSEYVFDIANEVLNFGAYDIDLKKIIGSTNQYVPESNGQGDGNGSGNAGNEGSGDGSAGGNGGTGGGVGTGGTGTGIGTGSGTGPGDVINNSDIGNVPDIGELMDKIKMTSIIRISEGLNQIDVDYVIYDPYNEYGSVYVEVVSGGKVEVIYLSKTDTHITLNNLLANTKYKLNFIYTTSVVDSETGESELVPHTFEQFELKTKMPEYSISVYKISKVYNTLTYKVNLQSGFSISRVNVNMSFNYQEFDSEKNEMVEKTASLDGYVDVNEKSGNYVLGSFDISGYDIDENTLLKLTIKSVVSGDVSLPVNSIYTFRFGR